MPPDTILGIRVTPGNYADTTRQILDWARAAQSRYICCAAVNNIMEARRSAGYRRVMDEAALVTPDGMPLVWMLRWLGTRSATRVYGPDLTLSVLAAAEETGLPVGLYGGTDTALAKLMEFVHRRFPQLNVVYAESPPFRPLTEEEEARTTEAMNRSGARILFIGLGSPKQDRWMHAHQGRVQAVMLGVGAAFDFLAGTKRQAPGWMRSRGLEWVFRLATEPRRLWKRYLSQNPRFMVLALMQLWRARVI